MANQGKVENWGSGSRRSPQQGAERRARRSQKRAGEARAIRTEAVEAALREGMAECDGCPGDGRYYGAGRVENGRFIGFTGPCYRCGGKGYQDPADVRRNRYYDDRVRRIRP